MRTVDPDRSIFSAVFGIDEPDAESWFDPVLTADNPVFVDPFLLDSAGEPEFTGASDELFEHFRQPFRLLAESPYADLSGMLDFPEMAETCLGYTASGTTGAGSGRHFADQFKRAMLVSIQAGLDSPRHFEEVALLSPGLGPDRVSDITTRVVGERFARYTERVSRELEVPVRNYRLWSYRTVEGVIRKTPFFADLPTNPHNRKAVLLVPKTVLRNLPTINHSAFEDYLWDYHQEDVRGQFNVAVKKDLGASILAIANRNPNWVREYVAWEEGRSPRPYSFNADPEGVGSARRTFYNMGLATSAGGDFRPTSPTQVLDFVRFLVRHFKAEIEQSRGYFLLYRDDACTHPRTEKAVQRLFGAMSRGACEIREVRMSREADSGMGPVDFTFATGYHAVVLVEMKLISNTRFWDGPGAQLPTYMQDHDADTGMFIAVGFTNDEVGSVKFGGLNAYVQRVATESGLVLDSATVDARPRPGSASTLRSPTPHP